MFMFEYNIRIRQTLTREKLVFPQSIKMVILSKHLAPRNFIFVGLSE